MINPCVTIQSNSSPAKTLAWIGWACSWLDACSEDKGCKTTVWQVEKCVSGKSAAVPSMHARMQTQRYECSHVHAFEYMKRRRTKHNSNRLSPMLTWHHGDGGFVSTQSLLWQVQGSRRVNDFHSCFVHRVVQGVREGVAGCHGAHEKVGMVGHEPEPVAHLERRGGARAIRCRSSQAAQLAKKRPWNRTGAKGKTGAMVLGIIKLHLEKYKASFSSNNVSQHTVRI